MITGMKIQVKDLLSFSELSLDLSSTKFYSVIGENGAGKTSFVELISIILYGRYSKGVDKKAIIRYGQDKGYGVFECIKDNDTFVIRREYGNKEGCTIHKNGESITAGSLLDTQKVIDGIFGGYDLFTAVSLYSQENFEPFIASQDAEKKGILEAILHFDKFTLAKERATQEYNRVEKSIVEKNNKILKLDGRIESLSGELDKLMVALSEERERLKNKRTDIREEVSRLLKQKQDTAPIKAKLAILNVELGSLERELAKFNKDEITSLQDKIFAERFIQQDLKSLRDTYTKIADQSITNLCPTCGQPLPKEKILDMVASIENEKKELLDQIDKKEKELSEIPVYKAKYKAITEEKEKVEENITNIKNKIASLKDLLAEYTESNHKIDLQVKEVESEAKDTGAVESISEQIRSISSTIDSLKSEKEDILKDTSLEEEKKVYGFWVEGFGNRGIKSLLLDKHCSFLSNTINYYLLLLTDGLITAQFSTTSSTKKGDIRDKISIDVIIDGKSISYKELSGGQKTIVNLAIMLSLRNLASSQQELLPIMFFDEVFASLDNIYSAKVAEVLRKISENINIFIVSHNELLKETANSCILLTYDLTNKMSNLELLGG